MRDRRLGLRNALYGAMRRTGPPTLTPSARRGVVLDLHNHTRYSHDGSLTPLRLLQAAGERGIHVVGVTDHGTVRGGREAAEIAAADASLPRVIPGQEVLTRQGEVIGLYLEDDIAPGLELEEAVAAIRRQGGLVYLPHPYDTMRRASTGPGAAERAAALSDIVEVENGRCLVPRFDASALALAARHGAALGAGSDAHYAGELGRAVVLVDRRPSRDDLVSLLRAGRPLRRRTPLTEALGVWFFLRVGFDKIRRAARRAVR